MTLTDVKAHKVKSFLDRNRVYVAEKCLCKTKGLEYLLSCFLILSIKAELCDLMCFKWHTVGKN